MIEEFIRELCITGVELDGILSHCFTLSLSQNVY